MRIVLILLTFLAPLPALAQHAGHMSGMSHTMSGPMPTEGGQSAFAAIQEIVASLMADPNTDWSKVDVEALRQHLIDMDNVTLRSTVKTAILKGGAHFTVSGDGDVIASIQRMTTAHAATMEGVNGWHYRVTPLDDGALMTVTADDPADVAKIRGLGFIGVMTNGMHHQAHHLMMARGASPH